MGRFLQLWDKTVLRPILEVIFFIAVGFAVAFFFFNRPEYRFAFNADFNRFGEGNLQPQFSCLISGDTAHYTEFEQRNFLRFRTQHLTFMEPTADDSSWGFVGLSLPLADSIPKSAREWNPATATSGVGQDVFVRLRLWNDCLRTFRVALIGGTELMAGQYRGGPEWFGSPAYFLSLKVPYDSFPTLPSVNIESVAGPADVAGFTEIARFAGIPGDPRSTIISDLGVLHLGTSNVAAATWKPRFGTDREFSGSWTRRGKMLWIPLMIGEDFDQSSEVFVTANMSRLTARRAVGDLVVGSRHFQIRASSLLQVVPREGVVRISSAERSFEATGYSSDVQINSEQIVISRFEAFPPAVQGAGATALLALFAFLLRGAFSRLFNRWRERHASGSSPEAGDD